MTLNYILTFFDEKAKNAINNVDADIKKRITEIRLRADNFLILIIKNSAFFIDFSSNLYESPNEKCIKLSKSEIDEMFLRLCKYSVYSSFESIKRGFFTLENGARIGVAGSAVYSRGDITSIKDIMSLNIRIPNSVLGASKQLLNFLFVKSLPSIIVAGGPNSGKTTLLRDLGKELSGGFMGRYRKVTVIDERNEFAGKSDEGYTLKIGVNTDVLSGFDKAYGIELATRTLSPEMIICDEISNEREVNALLYSLSCGVSFALSVHAENRESLKNKPIIKKLLESNEFSYIVLLDGFSYNYEIIDAEEVKNEIFRNDNADYIRHGFGAFEG